MTNKAIEATAKYFGISTEEAAKMIKEADKRNEETEKRGQRLRAEIDSGKTLKGGVALA